MAKRKGYTKKELHDVKKKELQEEEEYLRQVDRTGGRKFVTDTRKEEKRKDGLKTDAAKNYLDSKTDARVSYRERLARLANEKMLAEDFPKDWEYECIPTDGSRILIYGKAFKGHEGILFIIKSPKGNVYTRGISVTYDPEYDFNAVGVLITQVENTMDDERGYLYKADGSKTTKSGIYLPN